MRVALDTNILAYAEGVKRAAMKRVALGLVQKLPEGATLLPVQVLGELINLLVRKAGRTRAKAARQSSLGGTLSRSSRPPMRSCSGQRILRLTINSVSGTR